MILENTDFLCEKRLKEIDFGLHMVYKNSVFATDRLLANYKTVFPYFTNHTFEHSEKVINFCNVLIGNDNIEKLNADEIFILLMGAGLHDVGMGISKSDFDVMKHNIPGAVEYEKSLEKMAIKETAREFHHEFSAQFIKKYASLFEIPSDEHIYCISQIARGHRRINLTDEKEFPRKYVLQNGNTVHLAYLASVVRLSDELDVTSDRNLFFDYSNFDTNWSEEQTLCYKCHKALRKLETEGDLIILYYQSYENDVLSEIEKLKKKTENSFSLYNTVISQSKIFVPAIKNIIFKKV